MKHCIQALFFFILLLSSGLQAFGSINFTVTPIKYELNLQPWESITLPASLRNNSDAPVTLPTAASDFESSGRDGTPRFLRRSELVFPDQQLSSWISIQESALTINPWEEGTTNFTIDVPTTATPGWHYGAVFFKNDGSERSSWWNVGINVDYGIIILVNVSGDVIVDVDIEDPQINVRSSWWWAWVSWSWDAGIYSSIPENGAWYIWDNDSGQAVYQNPDSCPLWDFTSSRYDNRCFGWDPKLFSDDIQNQNTSSNDDLEFSETENLQSWDEPLLFENDFNIAFSFPISNNGNTHIKPVWKITIKDENGEIIKAIWKEIISNERGLVIGEEIVDYIPINDTGWNVLPKSQRIFESNWEGFPYREYDDEWNQIINYWSPSEYYTKQNKENAGFLMFWERVSEVRTQKTITAEMDISYLDENGEPIEFSVAKEFPVQYIEEQVRVNPYVILWLLLLATAILFILFGIKWWFLLLAQAKCWKCKEKIKGHWKTCPYCKTIQNKNQQKKFEKQAKWKK